jgi:hypothetical protein
MMHACHPHDGKPKIGGSFCPCRKTDPISKITRAKTAGDMAQAVEHLPSKCEALNSNIGTTKRNEGRKERLLPSHLTTRASGKFMDTCICPRQLPLFLEAKG